MDWNQYKSLCEQPDHFSRWALEVTASHMGEDAVRHELLALTGTQPLLKPGDHRGGPEADYFGARLSIEQVSRIAQVLDHAARESEGKTQRRLLHLRVVWEEYLVYLEG